MQIDGRGERVGGLLRIAQALRIRDTGDTGGTSGSESKVQ